MNNIETPTNSLVDKYIDRFNMDLRYSKSDKAIISLFEAFPENKQLEHILLKISVINDLYSTNILSTFNMALHIQKIDIDSRLIQGDPLLVSDISSGHGIITKKNNKEIIFYSFATKYCNWHNQDEYAIYDSFVHKILNAYKVRDHFSNFTETDLRNYTKFKKIVMDFKRFYNLNELDLKKIDKFLWIYGKEKFPTNYKKKE